MSVELKEKRIEFRVPLKTKKILEEAAKMVNLSLSSYILSICLKQAKMDLEQNEIILLNNKERDNLMKELSKPSKPNKALINLFKK